MNERRMSLGNRVISLVLALVMVIGMLPAGVLSFFAAADYTVDTTTTNVGRVKAYAANLLKNNFSLATSASAEFSWDTEKQDAWRYFNGVMLDSFLMLGINSDGDIANATGNALEFASNYYNTNVLDNGYISRYSSDKTLGKELDSIAPARAMFDLLDTTEDKDKYETALKQIYSQLSNSDVFTAYPNQGGNLLHKPSWTVWSIGLDGIYMAQPFFMEYANALAEGKITDTSTSANQIYQQVYNRLIWVANNMYDETTGLYNHGYSVKGGKVKNHDDDEVTISAGQLNGVFWSRGIGWYAVGLVDCIDMMPEGNLKQGLIDCLPKLFDGMLEYQDENSGMWYNIVNETGSVVSGDNKNQLETSGTGLMAYALLKAYTEGWLDRVSTNVTKEHTSAEYAQAGLNAFNGVVSKKLNDSNTTLSGIYKQSGVEIDKEGYCKHPYKSNEAKGVGGVLMAASVAEEAAAKLNGTTYAGEQFLIGAVSAPSNLTVPIDGSISDIDFSNIKVTLVSTQGTVKTQSVSANNCTISSTAAAGTATVTVKNGDVAIDTFTVQVVARAGEGTTEKTYTFSAPDDVSEGSDGSTVIEGTVYNEYFTVVGVVKRDVSSSVIKRVELAQDVGGALQFTVAEGSTANVTVSFSSNSDSNTSEAGIVDANGDVVAEDTGKTNVKGTSAVEFKYTNLPAGTYRICSPTSSTYDRIVRLYSVTVVESVSSGGSSGDSGSGDSGNTGPATVIYEAENGTEATGVTIGGSTHDKFADLTINGQAFTQALKIDSNGKLTYVADADGVLTFYVGTQTAGRKVQVKEGNTQVASYTISKKDVAESFTVDVTKGKTYVFSQESGETALYMATFAPTSTHTHSYTSSVTKQPTCTEAGVTTYTCACGDSYTEAIAALGHSYTSAVTTAATCTTAGVKTYTCSTCSETKTETIAATGHNYVNGTCSNCGAADPNYNPGGSDTPAANEYVIADAMVDGKQYILGNNQKPERAAYWDGDSWATGTISRTEVSGKENTYTIEPSTGFTLFTWESTGTNTGRFYSYVNGNKVYLNDSCELEATSASDATVFTVDLSAGTVKGDNNKWLKVDSGALAFKSSEDDSKTMQLLTPTSTSGGTTDPDEPDTPDVPTGSGFVLDTSGNVDWENGEYIVVWYTGSKYYAMQAGSSSGKEVTVTNGVVNISYADASNIIWKFNNGQITNGDYNLKNDSTPSNKTSSADDSTVVALSAADGKYAINLEGDNRWLTYSSSWTRSGTTSDNKNYGVYLYKWSGETGGDVVTPTSATVTPNKVNVANSGTIDLSGVTMEVTMSDGSKKTVQNSSLTYDVSGINTALAGTYTVPVSYTENGKTVSANVSVVVAAASSGTTTSEKYIHNFTEDNTTDPDNFYTFELNGSKSGLEVNYGDLTLTTGIKMNSKSSVSFDTTADGTGTLTLVFNPANSDNKIALDGGDAITIPSTGIVTITGVSAGSHTVARTDGESHLMYIAFTPDKVDGIEITAPGTLYIAGSTESFLPTHELQYVVRHNDADVTTGYTIEWSVLDKTVVSVDESGKITGLKPGTTSVSAKVTMADDTVYNDTVLVTVAGPTVTTTEEMSLIFGETGKDTGVIESVVRAGGAILGSNFELGYKSSDETVATVTDEGVVTAAGEGTATIYTYIKKVNGHTVYEGNGTTPQPSYFDSTVVTVTEKEVTNAHLNSYDYVIKVANSASDATNLINALTYKEDVNVTGGVTADTGMVLTIEFNTGDEDTIVAKYPATGLTVDYSGIDFSKPGIQTALVTYTADGKELFRDTIWVHVENMDLSKFDGVITKEDGIHYVLDNDGINRDEEYIIVAGNGEVALKNPSATSTGTSGATTAAVTLANGVLKSKLDSTKNLFDGAAVDYLTISEADEQQVAWLLDTFVENVTCPDDEVRTQLNASNLTRYLGAGETENQLIHGNVAHVYLETVSEADGEYRIVLGFGENKAPYYLACVDGAWIATTEPESVYMYNKHVEMTDDYGIKFSVTPTEINMNQGTVSDPIVPTVIYNENENTPVSAEDYTIVWSSSDPSVATVDQNGKVTGVKQGTATISATLYDVYGMAVTCTTHNVPYVVRTVTVNVSSTDAIPTLIPNELTIGVGSMPNLDKVNIVMYYGENNQSNHAVPHDQLNFLMADATNSVDEKVGFDNTTIGTYIVPVKYNDETYTLTIHVVEDPFAGLEKADSIPGYPDAGSVRMNKIAQGVEDFTKTGIAKIELTAAGVSTKNSVDVVLIVDVSNSMGWTTTWFENMTPEDVDAATDSLKIPANGADGTDKLDLAMATANEFAKILLNVEGGDNTITFVTFAGADRDHGGSSDHVDSVRTPMVGISEYSIASQVFADTKFTAITPDSTSAKYTLQIGGYSDDGYGEAKVSGTNRGNTNYDYAFGEAIDAVNQLKAKYNATHDDTYEESGRQIHVIFMTDGAPSHYNNKRGNDSKSSSDTSWDGSGTKYSKIDNLTEANWLAHIKNYNNLATQLYPMIDGAYTIGFDMAHGGFGDYSYALEDMERVLQGLAKNTVVPVEMAENEDELDTYLTSLARALAYPGTKARITDKIGGNFSLFTGVSMYSSDIKTPYIDKDGTEKQIMSEDLYNKLAGYNGGVGFPITVYSYRLVTAEDVGDELSVINGDGTTETVTVAEKHLGLRVNEAPEILERITFSADGTQAFSDQKEGNIMTIDANGNRVINAATFTYTATLDTMKIDDVDVVHAAEEEIVWKVGTIEEREVAMEYYAYLDGSLDNPREAKAGVYATNEFAYLEYIDVYGKYVKRYYGVPQIAWGSGNVTVRFYLVDKTTGKFVNRAGVTFTNPANRIFLDGRAQYEAELNSAVTITAKDALVKAGLASHELYDASMAATVTNSTTAGNGAISWVNANLPNIDNLKIYTDSSDGYFSNVVIDIPVVMTDLTESLRPMAGANVVIDFSNPVDINVVSTEEKPLITNGYEDVRNPDLNGTKYLYKMEIAGFGTYSADHDLKDYIAQSNITLIQEFNAEQAAANPAQYMYPGKYGYFTITDKDGGNTQIRYTPTAVMGGVENVFVAVKFMEYDISTGAQSDQFYYMYKHLSVVPATVVHYETTDNMEDAFVFEGAWGNIVTDATYQQGVTQSNANAQYGFEANYSGYVNFAGGSSQFVNNTNTDPKAELPSVKFTFTGTGIDIISKTGENQGLITMTLTGKNTGTTKRVRVLNKGTDDLYQLPVLSVENLPYDTYNVEISVYFECKVYGGQFYFDAIKVYGTAEEDEAVSDNLTVGALYKAAGEYKPQIVEIRDILLDNKNFGDIAVAGVSGAVYIDGNSTLGGDSTNFTDYDKIGPNNEVYLSSNQAIAFKLKATDTTNLPATLAIGLKALNTSVDATIIIVDAAGTPYTYSYNGENAINSSTAMFYNLLGADKVTDFLGNADGFTVVIANKDSDNAILSVTDLKIAYGDTEGQLDVIVDNGVAENANAALAASARVESVEVTGDAYAMQTTPITVVTGQAARSVEIVDSNGNMVAVKASFVDGDGGKRTWTILATFTNIRKETITVYGIGTDGNRHIDSATNATVNVMAQNTTN